MMNIIKHLFKLTSVSDANKNNCVHVFNVWYMLGIIVCINTVL